MDSTKRLMERTWKPEIEVVEGLIYEGDKIVVAGPYAVGKSPLLQDLACHLMYGLPWCGRKVKQKPIIYIDYENTPANIVRNIKASCTRLGVPAPDSENQILFYLQNDVPSEPNTMELLKITTGGRDPDWRRRWAFLKRNLDRQPTAFLIIDPLPLFLPIKWNEPHQVDEITGQLKVLMAEYPEACFLGTHNLRKWDSSAGPKHSLDTEPREWLDEVSGSGAILYRADLRLGMDQGAPGEKILGSIRRVMGELPPLYIEEAYTDKGDPAGFELLPIQEREWEKFLGDHGDWWKALPKEFKFTLAVKLGQLHNIHSRATISKYLTYKLKDLGAVEATDNGYRKLK